ncbi:MAG: rhomboid family intramembrane serine protease [Lachnospiraceae bacterium]|nr:rhomboid family intramembrane serine protease [Lachnospiraceae bacterium]
MNEKYRGIPYITIGIIIINVVYFIVLNVKGAVGSTAAMVNYGASVPPLDIQGEYYRLFTSAFMHFDVMHIVNNMVMLYFVGVYIEEALGRWKYLLCYLLCAVGGNLVSNFYYMWRRELVVAAGASGAVFGLAGALAYIIIRNKGHYRDLTIQRMIIFLALCVYSGVANNGVNNAAHVGGLITGFLAAALLYRRKKDV